MPQRNYIDNARPDFLVYPLTGERLEIDRYFPEEKVGFEFNGPQHYGVTDMYPDEEQFRQRRVRDMFKIGACAEHGVVLTVLTAADLSVGRMRQKIPPRLPQDTVDMDDPVIQTLERLSRHYRRQIEKIENGQVTGFLDQGARWRRWAPANQNRRCAFREPDGVHVRLTNVLRTRCLRCVPYEQMV